MLGMNKVDLFNLQFVTNFFDIFFSCLALELYFSVCLAIIDHRSFVFKAFCSFRYTVTNCFFFMIFCTFIRMKVKGLWDFSSLVAHLESVAVEYELSHDKTNIVVSEQVRHKPGCTVTEAV